ncbi:AEC family transporter [Dyella sp.]|uniref:AEC family transporter n=1 Tax=Dyella sp. TaxID=1869338 RepID=UPI002ED3BD6E
MVTIIVSALVPIFFVLLLGYSAGRWRIVDNSNVAQLNAVVMRYAIPASLLAATAMTPRAAMLAQWPIVVILGAAMMLVYPCWFFVQRHVFKRSLAESAVQTLSVSLPNYAAAGLPVVAAMLGANQIVPVAVAIATGALLPSPITLALLELSAAERGSKSSHGQGPIRHAITHAITRPIVLAPIAGTLCSLLGLALPAVAIASFKLIGQAAGGMALFVTGLILSAQRFRLRGNVVFAVVVTNVIQPLIAWGIATLLDSPKDIAHVAILMAALPSGFFGILFGSSYGHRSEDAGSAVIASTLVSAVTLAVAIAWLYG